MHVYLPTVDVATDRRLKRLSLVQPQLRNGLPEVMRHVCFHAQHPRVYLLLLTSFNLPSFPKDLHDSLPKLETLEFERIF
jgi:hypothetical protein